jgi:hypothetical protein
MGENEKKKNGRVTKMFMVLSLLVLVEIVCFGFINKFMKKKTKKP